MTANAWKMASTVSVSMVSLASMLVVAISPARAEGPAKVSAPTRICVSYLSQVGAHSLDIKTMEREANHIWAPYGIAIEGLTGPCTTPGEGPLLKVRVRKIEDVRPAGIPRGTLGNIYFVAGKPTPLIDLWADEAVRVMGGGQLMLNQGLSDPRVRTEMGRLLGRSLAHELGHYLLGSRIHTEEGLMRASYSQSDGKHKTRGMFALDELQVAAVGQTLTKWRVLDAERQARPVDAIASEASGEPTLSVMNTAGARIYTRHGR
jgi:hypothetical protein